jgi:NIPSNAP protein
MKRRDFFAASALAGLGIGGISRANASDASGKEYFVLTQFSFESIDKQKVFDEYLGEAAVPAMRRAGAGPVGVFRRLKDDNPNLKMEADSPDLTMLVPHKSLESAVGMLGLIIQDDTFRAAGEKILDCPKSDPAYTRFEASLMLAFDGMPKLEVPSTKDTRVLQLRIYESHSIVKHYKKVEMFNEGGEIEVFRNTGLNPVFFGQALIGSKLPNLTYMLGFDDIEAMKTGWQTFLKDPGWIALKTDEQYKDTVSNISNWVLRPTAASQI